MRVWKKEGKSIGASVSGDIKVNGEVLEGHVTLDKMGSYFGPSEIMVTVYCDGEALALCVPREELRDAVNELRQ